MKFKLRLNGIEPELSIVKKNKSGGTNTYSLSLFYPYRYLRCRIYNRTTKSYLKKQKYPIIRCEGCGMGWAEWKITNPNYKKKDSWKVCQHCVAFYDFKFSKIRLEIIRRQEEDEILCGNR